MSFSFNFRAPDKAAAKAQAEVEFDKVIATQPAHAADKAAALANVGNAIDLLVDDDTRDISGSMNGYVSWRGEDTAPQVQGVAVQCSAHWVDRPAEAPAASASSGPVSA